MDSAVKVARADHAAADLRGLAARRRDVAQSRRLLAIAMVLEGCSRLDAARQAGMAGKPCAAGCTAITKSAWTA